MADTDLLRRVLEACSRSAPAPLFPSIFAGQAGLERGALDAAIDRLRLGGYIQIGDWVQGQGQGYVLTPAGALALQQTTALDQPAPDLEPEAPVLPTDTTWERGEAIRTALLEPAPPIVTMTLLFANLLMYAAGLILALMRGISVHDYVNGSPIVHGLSETLGSLNSELTVHQHQWWRLLSHQFLHGNLIHLATNMISLYFIGPLLEGLWGSKRFLVLYLTAGVVGGAAIVLMNRNAVGASGAISGLLTSLAVWLWLNKGYLPEQLTAHMMSRVGACLMMLVILSLLPGVSWEGHLGGALGGALVSLPLHWQRYGPLWLRLVSYAALVAIPLGSVAVAYFVQAPRAQGLANERAQDQLQRRLLHTENVLLRHHNNILIPLLRHEAGQGLNDPEFLPKAQEACSDAVDRTRLLLEELAGADPKDQSVLSREFANLRAYFEAWSELFESAGRHLQEPQRWNPARRDALVGQLESMRRLRLLLEENTALPRFSPLLPQDAPGQGLPPPNTARTPSDSRVFRALGSLPGRGTTLDSRQCGPIQQTTRRPHRLVA
jgi:membrane associated rhomboid family serine protease